MALGSKLTCAHFSTADAPSCCTAPLFSPSLPPCVILTSAACSCPVHSTGSWTRCFCHCAGHYWCRTGGHLLCGEVLLVYMCMCILCVHEWCVCLCLCAFVHACICACVCVRSCVIYLCATPTVCSTSAGTLRRRLPQEQQHLPDQKRSYLCARMLYLCRVN